MSRRRPARCVKVRYAKLEMAIEARARIDQMRAAQGQTSPSRIYQCPICKGWHLTTGNSRRSEVM